MKRKRWLRRAGVAALALVAGYFVSGAALRTGRVKGALTARFERAFGRPVEVSRFTLRLLPGPRLEAKGVTVGEDPAFGYEYFLRAERVTAGLRWSGLLRGRVEFGTFSFTRPSLNLVRDSAGRWNLDRWLPPARPGDAAGAAPLVGPAQLPAPPIRLDLVEFDDGRINFKREEEKLPFAFTAVTGRVEQIAPGRWTLRIEAQPWRSGTLLQAAGKLVVRGDLAGTSARLQPAEIRVHWGEVSLADLLRLARGQDYGLRGGVTVDAVARSGGFPAGTGAGAAGVASTVAGEWGFRIEARARRIHRWDLTERRDNPAANVLLDGSWNPAANEVRVARLAVEGPHSNVRGEAVLSLSAHPSFELRLDSAGIQLGDALAWYRGFHANVAEETVVEGFLRGSATLAGWPFTLQNAAFSMSGATLRVPGLAQAVRLGPVEGGRVRSRLALEPVWITLGAAKGPLPAAGPKKTAPGRGHSRPAEAPENAVLAAATHDLESGEGALTLEGRVERAEEVLAVAVAIGRPLERGWTGKGSAAGALRWAWQGSPAGAKLSGHVNVRQGELQVAGLNLPLAVNEAQLHWSEGKRGAHLGSVEGFGAEWSGEIEEDGRAQADGAPGWKFQLHTNRLNAAELDRWTGPRARPGWLERLLPTLLGNAAPGGSAGASELIRRIRAAGEIRVEQFTVEGLSLARVKAAASLRDFRLELREATAEYAGGTVRGSLQADFAHPRYVVDAQLEKVRLAELLAPAKGARAGAEQLEGSATGEIHLATEGVGREELLQKLEGRGLVQLRNVALRGWDVPGAGLPEKDKRILASRWAMGESEFSIGKGAIEFNDLWLQTGGEKIGIGGTVSFSRIADLSLAVVLPKSGAIHHFLTIEGALDTPKISAHTRIE